MSTRAGTPIAIVGIGVRTPAGSTPAQLWASLCAGVSTAQPFNDPRLPDGTAVLGSRIADADARLYDLQLSGPQRRRLDRTHLLALGAADDAIAPLRHRLPSPTRCAVVCGIGYPAPSAMETHYGQLGEGGLRGIEPLALLKIMPNTAAAHLSLHFGFSGPVHTVSTACASGAHAIGEGVEILRRGAADLVLAGGVDAMVTYSALCGFLRLDAMSRNVADPAHASRPFDAERDGFVLGEGAGFCVLRRLDDAIAEGNEVVGTVLGYGSNADAHHLVAPLPDGDGARRCMELALADAGLEPDAVNHVNAHGTSTVRNDAAEAAALRALFAGAIPPVTAPKGTTGHLVGGSGAVEAIVTVLSLRAGVAPPIAGLRQVDPSLGIDAVIGRPRPLGPGVGLSNAFGFGGSNAVLVLGAS